MAFLSVQFPGHSIGKQSGMNIILPPGNGPFPVLYLLHGLSDDHTTWARRTSIERYVDGCNLMVVMPDGGRSFYCNDIRPGGMAYEDHIVRDVVGFVDTAFRTVADAGARAIAGLSMGGYGALMLTLRHPDMFSVACSHSAVTTFLHPPHSARADIRIIAGNLPQNGRYDLFKLSRYVVKSRRRPALRMDCGRDDDLIRANRAFHTRLKKIGYAHEYRENSGAHNWEYWDLHIRESIAFILANLRLNPDVSRDES